MTIPKTPARLDAEARKARMQYQDRGAFAGSSETSEQACWEEAVRPLVEEIERLRVEPKAHDLTPSEVATTKIVITRRFADYHAAIDGTNGCKWGCGKTIDEAVGSLVRNHPGAFGAIVDLEKAGIP